MASEMMEALELLCQEKHIDQLYLIDRLEQSLAKSYTDVLHLPFGARVTIDRQTGRVYVYELVPRGEEDPETGEYTEFDEVDVTPPDTSRIAAQHAKAEIKAIVRNAARVQIYEEFSQRVGDIITGTVLQSTPDFTIIKIREGVEAELPHFDQRRYPEERNERPAGERYSHNQRIRAIIVDVRDPNSTQPVVRGERQRPPIVVSRTHPDLLRRLFELEVPEVYDGVVEIRSIAREPGVRSKVAVSSNDDPQAPTLTISVTTAVTQPGKVTIPVHVNNGAVEFTLEFAYGIAIRGQNGTSVTVDDTDVRYPFPVTQLCVA